MWILLLEISHVDSAVDIQGKTIYHYSVRLVFGCIFF